MEGCKICKASFGSLRGISALSAIKKICFVVLNGQPSIQTAPPPLSPSRAPAFPTLILWLNLPLSATQFLHEHTPPLPIPTAFPPSFPAAFSLSLLPFAPGLTAVIANPACSSTSNVFSQGTPNDPILILAPRYSPIFNPFFFPSNLLYSPKSPTAYPIFPSMSPVPRWPNGSIDSWRARFCNAPISPP